MLVVFGILEVKDLRFWPLKSLITGRMTLITVWLDLDCCNEHFLFYNLLQNINRSKDILQILWALLGPLFKGPAPSAWYQMKDWLKLNNFCSILFNKIYTSHVLCLKICPKNEHFSNIDFLPLPSLVKSKIIKKQKPMCATTIFLVFKFIWFNSLALALSEPLSGNQSPPKIFKGQ